MRTKKGQNYKAHVSEDIGLKQINIGTWKIAVTYISKSTGEIFRSGVIVFCPTLYYEIANLCNEIEKNGGFISEVKATLLEPIIK